MLWTQNKSLWCNKQDGNDFISNGITKLQRSDVSFWFNSTHPLSSIQRTHSIRRPLELVWETFKEKAQHTIKLTEFHGNCFEFMQFSKWKNFLLLKSKVTFISGFVFFYKKKKQNRSCGSEASHFEIRSSETHIWGRISWRIRWWAQNPAGTTKSSCNSRQFMSDRNFRKNHEKRFLCRISWGIEWCHPFSSTTPKSSPKCKKSISRFDLDHFSTFPGLLNRIFGILSE